MSAQVFAVVVLSAAVQAGWNFAVKRSSADRAALLGVGWLMVGSLLIVPGLATAGEFDAAWLPFIFGTAVLQGAYICLLSWAYSKEDFSVVFPVTGGLCVLATSVIYSRSITVAGAAGVAAVIAGTLAMGRFHVSTAWVALSATAYTLVDMSGARVVPNVLYLAAMHVLAPLAAAPYLISRRAAVVEVLRARKREAFGVAVGGCVSYALVLWSYERAHGPYVAALREVSVVIAAGLGVVFLRERLSKRKTVGVVLIFAGAVLLRLA